MPYYLTHSNFTVAIGAGIDTDDDAGRGLNSDSAWSNPESAASPTRIESLHSRRHAGTTQQNGLYMIRL